MLVRRGLKNGAVSELSVTQWCHKVCPFFLSVHVAILTMLAFFLRLSLLSTVDLGSQAPRLYSLHADTWTREQIFSNCPFLSGKEDFPREPSADFLMGAFDRIRLLDHTPSCREAGKASISYFQLMYWEVGSSNKGWGRKRGCLLVCHT